MHTSLYRTYVRSLAGVSLLAILLAHPVKGIAAPPQVSPRQRCAVEAHLLPDALAENVRFLDAMGPDVEAKTVRRVQSLDKSFVDTGTTFCKPTDPNALFVTALLATWQGDLDRFYAARRDDQPEDLEFALQLLTQCTSRYFGTDKGAVCGVWARRVAGWQADDELETPDP